METQDRYIRLGDTVEIIGSSHPGSNYLNGKLGVVLEVDPSIYETHHFLVNYVPGVRVYTKWFSSSELKKMPQPCIAESI